MTHRLIDLAIISSALRGEEVRIEEEGQVVNGYYRFVVSTEGGNEVGTMEEVQPQRGDLQRQGPLFPTVVAGGPKGMVEKVGPFHDLILVLTALEEEKLLLIRYLGQPPNQVDDILPDAGEAVVDQTGIYAYAHPILHPEPWPL
jgi:hypothetical protein